MRVARLRRAAFNCRHRVWSYIPPPPCLDQLDHQRSRAFNVTALDGRSEFGHDVLRETSDTQSDEIAWYRNIYSPITR